MRDNENAQAAQAIGSDSSWRFYQPLIERHLRHRLLLRAWLVIYAFVGIQMGWVLRAFIGSPGAPTQFFRQDAWGNAYVRLANILWAFLGG